MKGEKMRLIDADALKEDLLDVYLHLSEKYKISPALRLIRDAPIVDAVEVVRCKDCIYYATGTDEWGSCSENPMGLWRGTDYCSWAERREDEKSI